MPADRRARRRAARPVEIDDLLRLRFITDAQVSPDGARVAYVETWVDAANGERYRSRIMLVGIDGSNPRPLTSGNHRDTAPRWSPDGRRLAFLSNRADDRPQLFVLSLDGGEPWQVTRLKHGAGPAAWSPDGARLAFSATTDVAAIVEQEVYPEDRSRAPRVRVVERPVHKRDGAGLVEAVRQHLYVVDADGQAEPKHVTDGDWEDTEPAWSPDGGRLAFTSYRDPDRDFSFCHDLWVVPANGGRARCLTRGRGQAAAPSWSPDGRWIAYLGHERGSTYGAATELLVIPASGGEPRSISRQDGREVGNVVLFDARDPLPASPPIWDADGRTLTTLASQHGRVEVVRYTVEGGEATTLLSGPREVANVTVAAANGVLAFAACDPTHPYEVFTASPDGSGERQVSHANADLLGELQLAEPEERWFRATDGEQLQGWLLRPPGARRRRVPLILEIHGGPELMYGWTFTFEFQVLAARGYAVLYTNPRGSRGYGEPFTARIFADWGNQDQADLLAALDEVAREPWVNSSRLGVAGGSYGGYMTTWLVGHTDRFRAAVAMRGLYSWTSFYGTSDIGPAFGDYVLGGPVYEREALYRERSPLTYARQMQTPLLLIHNEGDQRCPMEQAEQLFTHLRRAGHRENLLLRFPEENHNLSRNGRPDRRLERLRRIVGWFNRYLGDGG